MIPSRVRAAGLAGARGARPRTPSAFLDGAAPEDAGAALGGTERRRGPSPDAAARGFAAVKQRILRRGQLGDHSPRGHIDPRVAEIVEEVNRREAFATTSSCSGRVLFLSLRGQPEDGLSEEDAGPPLPAVRSTSGRWRISHEGISDARAYFCLEAPGSAGRCPSAQTAPLDEHREHLWLVVQPFDLHVACATSRDAGRLLAAARPAFPRAAVLAPAGVAHRWGGGSGAQRAGRTVVSVQGEQRLEMPFTIGGQLVYCGCLSALAGIVNRKLARNWAAMDSFLELLRAEL